MLHPCMCDYAINSTCPHPLSLMIPPLVQTQPKCWTTVRNNRETSPPPILRCRLDNCCTIEKIPKCWQAFAISSQSWVQFILKWAQVELRLHEIMHFIFGYNNKFDLNPLNISLNYQNVDFSNILYETQEIKLEFPKLWLTWPKTKVTSTFLFVVEALSITICQQKALMPRPPSEPLTLNP